MMAGTGADLLIFDRRLRESRDYWINRLARTIERSNIELDYPRPEDYCDQTSEIDFDLTGRVFEELCELTGNGPFLIYTTLIAALNVCLYKYKPNKTIVVGTPARRHTADQGEPANALAIVEDLDDNISCRQLLLNVRATLLEAYAKQHYPFGRLLKDLGLTGSENRCPLFDIALVFSEIHTTLPRVKNDITINVAREPDRLSGRMEFSSRLFEPASISRFAAHFENTLRVMLENVDLSIDRLDVVSEAERRRLLIEWNNTETRGKAVPPCIHELFEAKVEEIPHAIAVVSRTEHLTYRDLNRRANKLAHHLQSKGVGPESLVAVCLDRSLDLLVSLLGVLKAGGAYVPLDPSYPSERLAFMLEDARTSVILTRERLRALLPPSDACIICLDADSNTIARCNGSNTTTGIQPDNLVYVIYTSGSTGRPKGVQVQHRGLCSLVEAQRREFRIGLGSRVFQFAPSSFDASVSEIFVTLASGGALCLPTDDSLMGQDLISMLRQQAITTVTFPPSILAVMPDDELPELQTIISAGEACPAALAARWGASHRFLNAYGPTEATVCATISDPVDGSRKVSIGRPIDNTRVYLLDSKWRLVPGGCAAELCIAGVGLARGYHGRADQTAERFVPDPFAGAAGARMYRTGDLARHLTDGSIEYQGRVDDQVKIRGNRIELEEIEAVLSRCDAVREAVVLVQGDEPSERRLVAYVVTEPGHAVTLEDLRGFLKRSVPDYMIPSVFVMLDEMPLTASGKLDRRSLPQPDSKRPNLQDAFAAPTTPVQEAMAGIWSHLLGLEVVGIHDNFFDLGGHSLVATQMMSRLRDTFKVELPLRCLFESPTVAGLARSVEAAMRVSNHLQAPPITPVPRDAEIPLSFAQQRLWFIDQIDPNGIFYNIPTCIRLNGRLNRSALERSFDRIIQRHETLRTTFAVSGEHPVQVISQLAEVVLPVVDLQGMAESKRGAAALRLAAEEANRPFDLSRGPLIRFSVIRLAQDDHFLLLTMHHIVSDGWSIGVLVNELAALYEAFSEMKPPSLPDLPVQYADFAYWQRGWLRDEVLQGHLEYWRRQLGDNTTTLELPTDRPRPAIQTYQGASQSFALSDELSENVRRLTRREGVTLFMALAAAFKALLHRYTGQHDITIGTPIAGRNWAEVEGLVGFFVNTLVLRTDLSGDPSFRQLVGRVRETALGGYAHQDMPFEKLVEQLQPERDLSHQPLFQVMFVLQNAPMKDVDLPNLTLKSPDLKSSIALFDLTLSMMDTQRTLVGSLEYNTSLFEEATVRRLLEHFRNILEAAVGNPDTEISALPLMSPQERDLIVEEWNLTAREFPADKCIHHLVEQQAMAMPESVAVVCDLKEISFGELNRRADQLARDLISRGVGPESVVGICLQTSIEMIVGMLGILKAGGAYAPIDAACPAERARFMIEDSRARVVVTQESVRKVVEKEGVELVSLDGEMEEIRRYGEEVPMHGVETGNLAYLIYTSGSTGAPKGALITHGSLVSYALDVVERFRIQPGDRVLQFAPISFDVAVEEIFPTLIGGGIVVLRSDSSPLSCMDFLRLIESESVTCFELPTAFWHELAYEVTALKAALPPSVRLVIAGGEVISPERLARWREQVSAEIRFINIYGLTETTVTSTCYELTGRVARSSPVPVGRPIANTRIYILDPHLQPVPIGVVGELYIGGAGVGRGYVNSCQATVSRFLPDPFSMEPGLRLYKTGDLARFLPDGNIVFLRRSDNQVKIRGFRIELAEIETVLRQHPAVRDCTVVVREYRPNDKRLVAYLVLQQDCQVAVDEVQTFLVGHLPAYMIPAMFVLLDSLPLTPTGKVDCKALPALDRSRAELPEDYTAPRSAIEQDLVRIWTELLGIDRVGVHDNFFNLGGHSLLATQVVSRIREGFQVEVPLRRIFETPTVAGLAVAVVQAQAEHADIQEIAQVLQELEQLSTDQVLSLMND